MENDMELFNKTSTTLVYLASKDYAMKILQARYQPGDMLYIHVQRDKGHVSVYRNNDPNELINIGLSDMEHILKLSESDR